MWRNVHQRGRLKKKKSYKMGLGQAKSKERVIEDGWVPLLPLPSSAWAELVAASASVVVLPAWGRISSRVITPVGVVVRYLDLIFYDKKKDEPTNNDPNGDLKIDLKREERKTPQIGMEVETTTGLRTQVKEVQLTDLKKDDKAKCTRETDLETLEISPGYYIMMLGRINFLMFGMLSVATVYGVLPATRARSSQALARVGICGAGEPTQSPHPLAGAFLSFLSFFGCVLSFLFGGIQYPVLDD